LQDGSGSCDIIAGGVDESGIFKGVDVSGVHLCALLRTFQLSKVFMPVDMETPVAALGQSLEDGLPLIVVTRGCFGRELDYGPGPVRNDIQKAVWQACRDMRAEMPQVLLTCIDIPANLNTDIVQGCLSEPLNQYRELMYQDGTWFTPSVMNAESLGKWMSDNIRQGTVTSSSKSSGKIQFNRKKFDWTNTHTMYGQLYYMGWKEVLQVAAPTQVPRRTDLNFADRAKPKVSVIPVGEEPSGASKVFSSAIAAAESPAEKLAAAKAYLEKYKGGDKAGLEIAMYELKETGDFDCMKEVVTILLYLDKVEDAAKQAAELKAKASGAKQEAGAMKLVVDCHCATGDLDAALEVAKAGLASVKAKSDDDATCEALSVVVDILLAKGEFEEASTLATSESKAKGKVEGKASALLAEALMAAGNATDAITAAKKAVASLKGLSAKKEAGEASLVLVKAQFMDFRTAGAGDMAEVLTALTDAVELCAAKAPAPASLQTAKAVGPEGPMVIAQAAAVIFKCLGFSPTPAYLTCAEAAIKAGSLYTAYWNGKQAFAEATATGDEAAKDEATNIMAKAAKVSEDAGKPLNVGGPVPLAGGDEYVTIL
jgi:tetratricopeptide (TPR) repeat protein